MASLVLSVAGAAAGSALLPAGVGFLGATISGAALGGAIGSGLGALVDQRLFGGAGSGSAGTVYRTRQEGPRLTDLQVMASSEGASIPRVYGRARLSGQLIWATDFEEEIEETVEESATSTTTASGGGGKGGGGGGSSSTTTTTTQTTVVSYRYYGNLALGLCEGPVARIGRVWADGKLLDLSAVTYRLHTGSEGEAPDPLIEAVEGEGNVPAFRGLAYVVFEHLPLAQFGNRIPQLQVEVFRALNDLEPLIEGVTIIPGATEFGYEPAPVFKDLGGGATSPVNTNNAFGDTDWAVALDQLQDTCANVARAGLVVTWFGTDLRCGECELRPGVERSETVTTPVAWGVAGATRATAHLVSEVDGRPAFGGTPSDRSVIRAIQDLKDRNLAVTFYPFIMMDVPAGNELEDPYTGLAGQPVYPWRGRITVDPAPGVDGSPDKTEDAEAQVDAFFGTAARTDFSIDGDSVTYSGPDEWSYRRMVLHDAYLCAAAGGVDAFLIGTEMRALTQVRSAAASYPAVAHLVALAADVKAILGGGTRVSYAADWSEYFGHQPQDGSGDVYFHLDPLWASGNVDFVGIDNYMPLSDWRDGTSHLDALAGHSLFDLAYLKANIAGGEHHDWYYASPADRESQTRTPITDGAHGKPWVFRPKDIVSWWSNTHVNRPGGTEAGGTTSWVPQSKPVWFTELGCPAVDRGSNQPNVFFDPKSAESTLPYFSRGLRDDFIQRQFLRAHHEYWDPAAGNFDPADNPVSSVYGGTMVPKETIHVWTWDARPYPAFPQATNVWTDGGNWRLGHWITGRLGAVPLGLLVAHIMQAQGFTAFDVSGLSGIVEGFVIDRAMDVRSALAPLMDAFFFDCVESEGVIRFFHRGRTSDAELTPDDLAVPEGSAASPFEITRGQETDLPTAAKLTYIEALADYRQAAIDARRQTGHSDRVTGQAFPLVMRQEEAFRIAETGLQDAWAARERAAFMLPPSRLGLDAGDVVTLTVNGRSRDLRLERLSDGAAREAEALATEPGIFGALAAPSREDLPASLPVFGAVDLAFLDLPLLRGDEAPWAPYVAATASPWPGSVAIYRSPGTSGFALNTVISAPATMGVTEWDFYRGPTSRWDRGNRVRVKLHTGTLASADALSVLGGANIAAIENEDGAWEVLQFRDAELVAPDTYELSLFLRGQGGTEAAMRNPVAAGARFVLLTGALRQLGLNESERTLTFNWRYGPAPRPISDASYTTARRGFEGIGLRPLSPVHVRAEKDGGGDIALTWIRRSRLNADAWQQEDVPLGEDGERYEIDILDGEEVVRTLTATSPAATYTASDQTTDFGSPVSSLTVDIFQLSAVFGRGTPRRAVLYV